MSRQEGSTAGDRNPGTEGTARLYMTMAVNDELHHTFTLFWANNPHTFGGLQKFVEEHVDKFVADQHGTLPILMCLNVDVPHDRIAEETQDRIESFAFRSIPDVVEAATVN